MSHSIGSAPSSLGSNGSKRFSRRYRTINTKSTVDENLFGQPQRLTQAQQMRDNKSSSSTDVRQAAAFTSPERANTIRKPQYIKHITKDLIREILVPEDQGQKSLVIDGETYGRLLKACNFKSKEQIEEEKQRSNQDQDRLIVRPDKDRTCQEDDNYEDFFQFLRMRSTRGRRQSSGSIMKEKETSSWMRLTSWPRRMLSIY
jgi:hypothetical protein